MTSRSRGMRTWWGRRRLRRALTTFGEEEDNVETSRKTTSLRRERLLWGLIGTNRRRKKKSRWRMTLCAMMGVLLWWSCWYYYYYYNHRIENDASKMSNARTERQDEEETRRSKNQRRRHPGEANEVCASWTPTANPNASAKMTIRKSYWVATQGKLTANELKRKSACAKGGGTSTSCWQRKLTDAERIRNVGSPSLARLTNETVVAIYRASEDVVGEDGQHLRVTMSRAGEGKGWKVSTPFEEVRTFHNSDWKRGSGMPMWDPVVFVERDGKGRAFVFYAVSDSARRGE